VNRADILDAAATIFRQQGVQAVFMPAIAAVSLQNFGISGRVSSRQGSWLALRNHRVLTSSYVSQNTDLLHQELLPRPAVQ
jgi:hypothetical protein